jgi:DNA topoisomerase-2
VAVIDVYIQDYKEHHDNRNVHFVVTMTASGLAEAEKKGLTEFFKLTGKVNTSNMMCFDVEGKIKKYNSPEEIVEEFYPVRLAYYQKRKVTAIRTQFSEAFLNRWM